MENEEQIESKDINNNNKINDEKSEEKTSGYNYNEILLIFNKLSDEYVFNIKRKKKDLIIQKEEEEKKKEEEEKKKEEEEKKKEDQKNEENKEPQNNNVIEEKKEEAKPEELKPEEAKSEEAKKEEDKKEEDKSIQNQLINLLEKELNNTTFNNLIESQPQNNLIGAIIKDYYLYFITRNESFEREINDLDNLSKLLEVICEFQYEFSKNNNLTIKDLLSLIIWTIDYKLELNEFLYCVEYFKKEKIFKKKNIFQEIINNRLNKVDIEKDDKRETIGLKKGIELILSVINDKCIDEPQSLSKVIEIIPTMYQIEQKYKLNSKEIYFLLEIKYIYLLIKKLNLKNDENVRSNFKTKIDTL